MTRFAARRSLILPVLLLAMGVLLSACAPARTVRVKVYAKPVPSATPDPAPSPSATPPPRCPDSGVRVVGGETDAAMGLRALGITVVNCGTRPYTVDGYPLLRILDRDRRPLAVTILHGSSSIATIEGLDRPPVPVTLKPGQRAVTVLVWRNTLIDPDAAMNGAYLQVTPGSGQPAQTIPQVVDLGDTGKAGVTAWARPR